MADRHNPANHNFTLNSMYRASTALAVVAAATAVMCGIPRQLARFLQRLIRKPFHDSKVLLVPSSIDALAAMLLGSGTDPSNFGVGSAKSLDALLKELQEGSCRLEYGANGRVCRFVDPTFVEVNFQGKVLVEKSQILEDGRTRDRDFLLAEKRDPSDSSVLATALRGFKEEIKIDFKDDCPSDGSLVFREDLYKVITEEKDSASYPGLPCVYRTHYVRMDILSSGVALDSFSIAGLPQCTAFETTEISKQGTKRLQWEWVDADIARKRGVKGFLPIVGV